MLEHCWSLGIEEQYYLVWPWVVLVIIRMTARPLARAGLLAGLACLFAAYRYSVVGISRPVAFTSDSTRTWTA